MKRKTSVRKIPYMASEHDWPMMLAPMLCQLSERMGDWGRKTELQRHKIRELFRGSIQGTPTNFIIAGGILDHETPLLEEAKTCRALNRFFNEKEIIPEAQNYKFKEILTAFLQGGAVTMERAGKTVTFDFGDGLPQELALFIAEAAEERIKAGKIPVLLMDE